MGRVYITLDVYILLNVQNKTSFQLKYINRNLQGALSFKTLEHKQWSYLQLKLNKSIQKPLVLDNCDKEMSQMSWIRIKQLK